MEDAQFSEAFFKFLQANVASVDAGEILLLLYRNPEKAFSPVEVLQKLGPVLTEAEVLQIFEGLTERGLMAPPYGGRFQFRAGSPELTEHVKTLAQAYEERPVTLFRLIYALRRTGVHALADAFKIRKS